jgi:DMSO/TMAO reductase YedYZ molybdopterin-dependent catalytic subunit
LISIGIAAAACGPALGDDSLTTSASSSSSNTSNATSSNDAPNQSASANPNTIGVGDSVKYTSNADFYPVDIGAGHPTIDGASWRLELSGKVEKPLKRSLDGLKALPSVTQTHTFECISNPGGGSLIGNALWVGAQMKRALALAGVKPGAKELWVRRRWVSHQHSQRARHALTRALASPPCFR